MASLNRKYSNTQSEFDFYIEVLKPGKDFYYRINPQQKSGGLAWAYRQVGKFNEVSLEHLRRCFTNWTKRS